jgi:hypothetical protein
MTVKMNYPTRAGQNKKRGIKSPLFKTIFKPKMKNPSF